jgi:hypothetical protein
VALICLSVRILLVCPVLTWGLLLCKKKREITRKYYLLFYDFKGKTAKLPTKMTSYNLFSIFLHAGIPIYRAHFRFDSAAKPAFAARGPSSSPYGENERETASSSFTPLSPLVPDNRFVRLADSNSDLRQDLAARSNCALALSERSSAVFA